MQFNLSMRSFLQDFLHAARVLRKAPGFTASAIVVLALGIGANTAIFSVVNAVLLRPLPFPEPGRLVRLWHVPPQKSFPGVKIFAVSVANFLDWRAQSHAFDSMAAYRVMHANLTGRDRPESILATTAEADFFRVVGVNAALGRVFNASDDDPASQRVAVLSHGFWQTHYGGSDSVLGRQITLDGRQHTIIGVMPADFTQRSWGATSADVFLPAAMDAETRATRKNHNWTAVARLKPGVDVNQARAELTTISHRLEAQYPEEDQGWGATAIPLREQLVGEVRSALLLLLGAVVFVLLIACANVANLVLARSLGRRKEMSIRVALGASRARMLRHIVAETLTLSLAGGVIGLGIAHFGVKLILAFLSDQIPRATEVGLDLPVLAFTFAISILTGVLAGVWPSWRASSSSLNEGLRQGIGRGDGEEHRRMTRSVLVVAEVALSLVLLIGAGLTIRSLLILGGVNPGLDPHNVLTMAVVIPNAKYHEPPQQIRFYSEMLSRVRSLPGVESAAVIDSLPLNGGGSMQPIVVDGNASALFAEQPEIAVRRISTQYLRTMRVPLVRGRDFTDSDVVQSGPVVLVSESMARRFWPGVNPIGRHVTLSFVPDKVREVVGVVGDVKDNGLDFREPVPTLYEPHAQTGGSSMELAVRTKVPPTSLTQAVESAVHEVDRELPLTEIKTMDDILAESLSQRRFTMMLLAAFAGLALALAAVGIYSVLSYTVRRRFREISIRVAVGAQSGDVLRLVVLEAMKPTVIGVALGIAGALAFGRVLATQVYGIEPTDLATFAGVSLLLITVALAASIVPAWRATRVDPMNALREN